MPESNPLLTENQYSGKIYWLNIPTGYDLNIENLRDHLEDHTFYDDLSDQLDDKTIVPDVFRRDGEIVMTTTLTGASIETAHGTEILYGTMILDDPNQMVYRDQLILVLDTTEAHFLIFEHSGHHYLVLLAKRETAESAVSVLRGGYREFGSTINTATITPATLETIREDLDAQVMDTIITDYPERELHSVEIRGTSLQDLDEFDRQRRRGRIQTYMFQTENLVPGETKTIGLSRDGHVRIYSNATIATFVRLLIEHVIPGIEREVESSPSLEAYDASAEDNPIYEEIGT